MKRSSSVGLLLAFALAFGLAGCTSPNPTPVGTGTALLKPTATIPAAASASPAVTINPTGQATRPATVSPTAVAAASARPVLAPASFPRPPDREPLDLARRLRGGFAASTATAAPQYKVGDKHTFWVIEQETKTPYKVTARIGYMTDHAYLYVADGVDIPAANLKASGDIFEKQTYPLLRKYFGPESSPGFDNDVRITVLNARIAGVGGYFSSLDTYPRSVNEFSNEREMVYMNVDSSMPGTATYNSTLAHEFAHMIQQNVMGGGETWLKEGSAEIGARAAGQLSGGLDALYVRDTDLQLTNWAETPSESAAHYGAAYLFLTYFSQRFGGYEAVGKLIATAGDGEAAFDKHLASRGLKVTFESIFKDWVVATYLDDKSIADGRYGYDERRPRRPEAQAVRSFPFRSATTVSQYGADYYLFQPTRGDLTIAFDGREDAKLLDVGAHGGKLMWWSNRGDEIDSRLTRKVDLSGTQKATLRFWTWFDIEENYDYAFVMVSTDGGKTWKTLPGKHTTTENPNGGNFGTGYTGQSGGTRPAWVQETVDLSAYAGKEILLRLEYVTDDAFNSQGIGFDDFEIPEIGWKDDAEGDGGWTAEGFVQTDNRLNQRFAVQVITQGKVTKVQEMELDALAKGQLVVPNIGAGRDVENVIVVVSGLAPLTNRPAEYQISASVGTSQPTPTPGASR